MEINATLCRKLAVPKDFLVTRGGATFGGDVRIGDLTGNGRPDFIVYRCNHGAPKGAHTGGMKPCFLGAFDIDGNVLWRQGEGGNHPSRPMSVALHDLDGDGSAEIVCFWHRPQPGGSDDWRSIGDVVVQIRSGKTGEIIREAAPKEITERCMKDPVGANWVHQRILVANFRG